MKRKKFREQPLSKQIVVIIVLTMAIMGLIATLNKSPINIDSFQKLINSYGTAIFIPYVVIVGAGRGVKNISMKNNSQEIHTSDKGDE